MHRKCHEPRMDRKLLVRNKICNSKLDFVSGRFVYQCCFTRHNKDAGLEQEKESCKGSMEGTSAPRCNDGSIEGSMYEGIKVAYKNQCPKLNKKVISIEV